MNGEYIVYRIDAYGYFYYGFTSDKWTREITHAKNIHSIIKNGDYYLSHKKTGKLSFHHSVALHIIKNKCDHSFSSIKCNINFSKCFTSKSKEESLYVEAFLIKKSLKRKKCCNLVSKIHLYEKQAI